MRVRRILNSTYTTWWELKKKIYSNIKCCNTVSNEHLKYTIALFAIFRARKKRILIIQEKKTTLPATCTSWCNTLGVTLYCFVKLLHEHHTYVHMCITWIINQCSHLKHLYETRNQCYVSCHIIWFSSLTEFLSNKSVIERLCELDRVGSTCFVGNIEIGAVKDKDS